VVKRRGAISIAGFAHPARELATRFASLLLILLAIMLMVLGKASPELVSAWRIALTDSLSPVLSILASPGQAVLDVADGVSGYFSLHSENERLLAENRELKTWYHRAQDVEAENRSLREILHFAPPPSASFIAAKVFAVPGGGFLNSALLSAGHAQGVKKGQAVLSGDGLVGRILEVGESTSRMLLLSDMSSRIPVILAASRERAVLAGNSDGKLFLAHLRPDIEVGVGERVVSSDVGGAFPDGLPVGVVSFVGPQGAVVEPYADPARLDVVQIVDFSALLQPEGNPPKQETGAGAPASP